MSTWEPARRPTLAHPLRIGPLTLAPVRAAEVVDAIFAALAAGRGGRIVTVNLELLQQAAADPEVAALFERAELRVADGMPLLWLARLGGMPLPERVAGSDLVWLLAERAAREGAGLFLLGGAPGAPEAAAERLREHAPGIRVVGWANPVVGRIPTEAELAPLRAQLGQARPDLVYCALGAPKQEYLAEALSPVLPGAWWLGCGISLSFLSGQLRRAPPAVRALGLEWLHRMVQEPDRLVRRYLGRNLPFLGRLVVRQLLHGDAVGREGAKGGAGSSASRPGGA